MSPWLEAAEIVLVQSDHRPGELPAPEGGLTDLLAQTLAADHGDHSLVLRLVPGPATPWLLGPDQVWRRDLQLSSVEILANQAAAKILATLTPFPATWPTGESAWVFLDPTPQRPSLTPAQYDALLGSLATTVAGQRALTRVALLSRDGQGDLRVPDLLVPSPTAPDLPPRNTLVRAVQLGLAPPRTVEPAYPPGTVRVALAAASLPAVINPGDLATIDAQARRALSRWGRGISERRVAVALGGGGAWGYAHAALLEALVAREIPIDLVSGASFGAIVGAYLCVQGRPGLAAVVDHALPIQLGNLAAPITSAVFELMVKQLIGERLLAELEVPLYPVATEVSGGTLRTPTVGTLSMALRKSCAFPGLYAPTLDGGRFVDGSIANVLPESALTEQGADLIIASNVIPPPFNVPGLPPSPNPLLRFLQELEPIGRVLDIARSCYILLRTTGAAHCRLSDVVYEIGPLHHGIASFLQARQIVDAVAAEVTAPADAALAAWQALAQP